MAGSGYAVGLPPAGQLQACCTLVAELAAIHDLTAGYVCEEDNSFNVHEQICNTVYSLLLNRSFRNIRTVTLIFEEMFYSVSIRC